MTPLKPLAQPRRKLIEILPGLLEKSLLEDGAVLRFRRAAMRLGALLQARDKLVIDISHMQAGHFRCSAWIRDC
nr:hypothetical protein [Mesorhizobium ephedrae]